MIFVGLPFSAITYTVQIQMNFIKNGLTVY